MILLKDCLELITGHGLQVSNMDCTVFAQVPKISPHKQKMEENIAGVLGVDPTFVNVKATTTEKLGFIGKEQGIAAQCTVLLTSIWE